MGELKILKRKVLYLLLFIFGISIFVADSSLSQSEENAVKDFNPRITEVDPTTIPQKYNELTYTESKTRYKNNYIISEEGIINPESTQPSEQLFNIEKENFFIIETPITIKNSNLYLLRYRGINMDDRIIYIDDELKKQTKKYIYSRSDIPGVLGRFTIVINKGVYSAYISDEFPYHVTVDLNSDGTIDRSRIMN